MILSKFEDNSRQMKLLQLQKMQAMQTVYYKSLAYRFFLVHLLGKLLTTVFVSFATDDLFAGCSPLPC